jgi:N-acetylglucosamine PTS system EIICBA or EIICB component
MNPLPFLQKIGASLMIPVAVLPAAAILLGVGYWIDPAGWGANSALAAFLIHTGGVLLDNMPLLFAIGVAFGMSRDKHGSAALAGLVGFLVVTRLCAPETIAQILGIPLADVSPAFGKINNQFIGILSGVISAGIYNRFSTVELHKSLAFFSGRRLVPILTSLAMIGVSAVLYVLWPILYEGLVGFGKTISELGALGAGAYGFFNRLLIPTGLHHALNSVFWFDVAGINDIPNFLGGARSIVEGVGIPGVTGMYQAGFFPIMMFGLVGAALAFVHTSRPENRARTASIMLAAGFATFLTGVTEPVEFAFLFLAPWLFLIHALLTGISLYLAASMQWIAGFGFSAGLIDLILSSRNPLAVRWYMLIPQGLVFLAVYYLLFRFLILRFDLKTPGREDSVVGERETDSVVIPTETAGPGQALEANPQERPHERPHELLARQVAQACGGLDNLVSIDACITRLRLEVRDGALVDDAALKSLGARGVIRPSANTAQVVFGARAENIADHLLRWK